MLDHSPCLTRCSSGRPRRPYSSRDASRAPLNIGVRRVRSMVRDRVRIEALLAASSTLDGLGGEMQRPRLRSTTSADSQEERVCRQGIRNEGFGVR